MRNLSEIKRKCRLAAGEQPVTRRVPHAFRSAFESVCLAEESANLPPLT